MQACTGKGWRLNPARDEVSEWVSDENETNVMCGDKKSTQTNAWQERDRKRVKTILQPLTVCIKKEEEAFTDKHNAYLILLASLVSIFIWHCLQVLHYDPHTFDSKYNIYICFFVCSFFCFNTSFFSHLVHKPCADVNHFCCCKREHRHWEDAIAVDWEWAKQIATLWQAFAQQLSHTHTHFGVRAFPSHQS